MAPQKFIIVLFVFLGRSSSENIVTLKAEHGEYWKLSELNLSDGTSTPITGGVIMNSDATLSVMEGFVCIPPSSIQLYGCSKGLEISFQNNQLQAGSCVKSPAGDNFFWTDTSAIYNVKPAISLLLYNGTTSHLKIYRNRLYASVYSGGTWKIIAIGNDLFLTGISTTYELTGISTSGIASFELHNENSSLPGPDTVYTSDRNGGLSKWKLNATLWSLASSFTQLGGFSDISGNYNGTGYIIYAVGYNSSSPNSTNSIYKIFNQQLSWSYTIADTATTNYSYIGVAYPENSQSDVRYAPKFF